MFFSFARFIVRILAWLLNGRINVENKSALPEGTYVLVGPIGLGGIPSSSHLLQALVSLRLWLKKNYSKIQSYVLS